MADFDSRLIDLFRGEINYLRHAGQEFSRKYPRIASRLEISGQESPDPQVERLLESFAFLTARIQARIEDQSSLIPAALLQQTYPFLSEPTPPMSTVRFNSTEENPVAPSGHFIPKGTHLFAKTSEGDFCRFLTSYDVDLRPIEVVSAAMEPAASYTYFDTSRVASVLKVVLKGQGVVLSDIPIDQLRLYLSGDPKLVADLHEVLISNVVTTVFVGEDPNQPTYIGHSIVKEVGFGDEDAVLPEREESLSAYRLLSEYFSFPEKFFYVDFTEIDKRPLAGELTILLGLSGTPNKNMVVSSNNFCTGCAPIINLFPKTLEPIRLNHLKEQYLLEPEVGGLADYEVHSIKKVTASSPAIKAMRTLEPYFGHRHIAGSEVPTEFWFTKRSSITSDIVGSQMHISFVDTSFEPRRPAGETVTVQALCSNRNLVEQLPVGAVLQGDEDFGAIATIFTKPSPTVYGPVDGETLWRLVSQLNLNSFSFSNDAASVEALREILRLYCPDYRPSAFQEVMGLRDMKVEQIVRRVGDDSWRGFCRGNKVTLTVDERNFVGGNPFLLGSVLSRFFSLYVAANSFCQLEIELVQRQGIWKKWKPVIGGRASI